MSSDITIIIYHIKGLDFSPATGLKSKNKANEGHAPPGIHKSHPRIYFYAKKTKKKKKGLERETDVLAETQMPDKLEQVS